METSIGFGATGSDFFSVTGGTGMDAVGSIGGGGGGTSGRLSGGGAGVGVAKSEPVLGAGAGSLGAFGVARNSAGATSFDRSSVTVGTDDIGLGSSPSFGEVMGAAGRQPTGPA
jgi:hypothetical protein